jgi:bleomycin hydrolase
MKLRIFLTSIFSALFLALPAQKNRTTPTQQQGDDGPKFTNIVELKATPVKNQSSTGTCWSFATTSFIESELIRMGRGEYDLSEMFIVRNNYADRLRDNYLRQGKGNLGEGSVAHDWMTEFITNGIVPDEVYPGLNYGSPTHNHGELNAFLNAVAAVPLQRKNESDQYHKIVNDILDVYLGKVPENFNYKGATYTPKTFAESLGINPSDYVEITSFTHFPFYTQGLLEIPDNWRMARYYNVPLDELMEIIDYSMGNGYTVNWDGDVSERGFTHPKGMANVTETTVTQESRQKGFETFTTTDDHLMHLTGITKDQNGIKYYITKNSWGTTGNPFGGYLNMSENYVRAKTISIMVHRNAIPPAIKSKLGII